MNLKVAPEGERLKGEIQIKCGTENKKNVLLYNDPNAMMIKCPPCHTIYWMVTITFVINDTASSLKPLNC